MENDRDERAPYEPPELRELGQVEVITGGGPGAFSDGVASVS